MNRAKNHAALLGLFTLASCAMACTPEKGGLGIGRPLYEPRPDAKQLVGEIREMYIGDGVTGAYAELHWGVVEDASSPPCTALCNQHDCVELSSAEQQTLLSGGSVEVNIDGLGLVGEAGELACVDGSGEVGAYVAWGASPLLMGSPFAVALRGAGVGVTWLRTPFPFPEGVALVNIAGTKGCAVPSPGSDATADDVDNKTLCPNTFARGLVMTQVWPAQSSADVADVWLTNTHTAPLSVYGLRVCSAAGCALLRTHALLAVNDNLRVVFSDEPEPPVGALALPDALAPSAAGDNLALVAPGGAEIEANMLLDYVRYGNVAAGNLRAKAVERGAWPDEESALPAPTSIDPALLRQDTDSFGPAAWMLGAPIMPSSISDTNP